jgi:gliding motility-associated-like protein
MKSIFFFILIGLISVSSVAQVVINEVHPRPSGGDTDQAIQSMYNATVTSGAEFVELYNSSPCDPVDISCWSLGGMDGASNGGAFSFPSGTVIPPLGFITVGGPLTSGITFNLNLAANSSRLWRSNASRWHLPNGDGWIALYDASGAAVDGVYWTFSSNDPGKLNTDDTFIGAAIQRIGACGGGGLSTASAIPGIEYMVSATVTGQSFERTTDGGTGWALGAPTPNNCNGSCVVASVFQLNATVQQPQCGQSNGSISFSPTPTDTYFYNWPFPTTGTTSSATNLPAGTYDITITNASGCTKDTSIVLVSTGGITSVDVISVDPSCGQPDGSVTITNVIGGSAPYQYSFNGATYNVSNQYNGLAASTYTLTVQDNAGCTYIAPNIELVSAAGPSSIAVSAVDAGCGASDGVVTLGNVTGGTSPYTYNFAGNGFGNQTSYTGLSAGTYTLQVQDAGGCIYSAPDVVVNNGNGPTAVVVTIDPENCDLGNGSVNIGAVTGGTAPYQYDFNGQGFSGTLSYQNLSAGNYTLTVQDAANCTYNAPLIIITEIAGPTAVQVTANDASCGNSNGSVQIGVVTGGTSPYEYDFNGTGFSGTTNYSDLNSGVFSLSVQDAAGCVYVASDIQLNNTPPITNISSNVTDASCNLQNGGVTLGAVSGGTSPFLYNFNGQGLSSSTSYLNLGAGTYTLTVQDAVGCTFSAPSIVINTTNGPTSLDVTIIDALCDGSVGSIQINGVSGGNPAYQYSLNGGAFTAATSYPDLIPGSYQITVLDATGCTFTTSYSLAGGTAPNADFAISPSFVTTYDPFANLINLSSSDVISYAWSIPNGNPSTSSSEDLEVSFLDQEPGFYPITLVVTNSDGCTDTIVKVIEVYEEIILFAPNSFTPDGDEFNNDWRVYVSNADLGSFSLQIFNRWGEMIFESNDPESGWDGTYGGEMIQDGTYTWSVKIKDNRTDNVYRYLGHINKLQ